MREGQDPWPARGYFTPWRPFPDKCDLLFYEGLHGAVVTDGVSIAQHADVRIGVVPVVNLEWIQKIHRARSTRFANPRGIDFLYLLSMIDSSFMSRANSVVIPGNKLDIAMQLHAIFGSSVAAINSRLSLDSF